MVNDAISYTKVAKISGSKQKTFTSNNLVNSGVNIVKDTIVNGAVSYVTGKLLGSLLPKCDLPTPKPTDSVNWTNAHSIVNAIDALAGTSIGIGYDLVGNKISEITGQNPTFQIFPETYVQDEGVDN